MSRGRTMVTLRCQHCQRPFRRVKANVDYRRRKCGEVGVFCSKRCDGLSRRIYKPKRIKVAEKAAYDREYRAKNAARLKAEKRAYYLRTFDPEKARKARKRLAKYHVAYCREYYADPVNKAAKVAYDRDRRAAAYTDFGPAWKVLIELETEFRRQMPDKYERMKARGYYERSAQERRP